MPTTKKPSGAQAVRSRRKRAAPPDLSAVVGASVPASEIEDRALEKEHTDVMNDDVRAATLALEAPFADATTPSGLVNPSTTGRTADRGLHYTHHDPRNIDTIVKLSLRVKHGANTVLRQLAKAKGTTVTEFLFEGLNDQLRKHAIPTIGELEAMGSQELEDVIDRLQRRS